ncbi:MAG TPA: Na-K-Cl cotransporter, partial [Gemmatimonadota bacterium]|nr:Na-K-Cl cotransporter [Gemmatimonadota bacterium]
LIVHDDPQRGFGQRRQIDVWWGGMKRNGGLMMLLAYLLRSSVEWHSADVTLKMAVPSQDAAAGVSANVSQLIARSRTGLKLEVVITGDRSFDQVLLDSSHHADLVMIGIAEPGDDFVHYYERLQQRAAGLPTTLYVLAAEDLEFGEVLVDRTAP